MDYYLPQVLTANDYYPFGMLMPGRKYSDGEYRYGFNGQEKSTEIDPTGNSMTAEFWQYDARLGRRWNVDPIVKIWESPYVAFSNNPILLSDPSGADAQDPDKPVTTKGTNLPGVTVTAKISKKQAALNKVAAFNPSRYVDFGNRFTVGEFKKQLADRINNPYAMDQGHKSGPGGGTNFCWAAAASSRQYERDPLQMTNMLIDLFSTGKANLGGITIGLSAALADAVGSNTFNNDGGLKQSQIDQLLFLGLAGSMKRYVNIFNKTYAPEDEDKTWASGSLGKFNELLKLYGNTIVTSKGNDAVSRTIPATALTDAQDANEKIFLFIYSAHFKEPKPAMSDGRYPSGPTGSHFIQVRNVTYADGIYTMDFWDYGGWTPGHRISRLQLEACLYGITTTK
ncbi:MAG: hypothetical protein QM781_13155 [Chitinophagaceae bacterium]